MAPSTLPFPSFREGHLLATLHSGDAIAPRAVSVVAALDASVAAASRLAAGWSVPCDIVGLGSKKAKAAKIRFHPDTFYHAQNDTALADAVSAAVNDLLSVVCLDGSWCLSPSSLKDNRPQNAAKLRRFLGGHHSTAKHRPVARVEAEWLTLSWPFHLSSSSTSSSHSSLHASLSKTAKAHAKVAREAASILTETAKVPLRVKIENQNMEGDEVKQVVELEYQRGGLTSTIWRLRLDSGYLYNEETEEGGEHRVEVNSRGLHVSLRRMAAVESSKGLQLPPRLPVFCKNEPVTVVDEKGGETPAMMLDAAQCRVEELRRRLDESLSAFQILQKTTVAKMGCETGVRQLVVLSSDRTETAIEICEAGARPRLRLLAQSTPLKVVVAEGQTGGAGEYASSPSESVDSGLSMSSPSGSPNATSASPKASPFYQYSEESSATAMLMNGMRGRSLSESASTGLYRNGTYSAPIKGILKKISAYGPCRESARSLRGVLKRSVSESTDGTLCHSPFIYRTQTVDEDPLEDLLEEDETQEEEQSGGEVSPTQLEPRVKRVSFSENIQRRSFRPNSSILGQKAKNARKERNKRRRAEKKAMRGGEKNEEGDDDDEDDEEGGMGKRERSTSESDMTSDMQTTTDDDEFHRSTESLDEVKAAMRESRKDSGFVDDDDVDEADDEEETVMAKQSQPPRPRLAAFTIGGHPVDVSEREDRGWFNLVRGQRARWSSEGN